MARHPTGDAESLENARQLLRASRTAEELRAAQAVLMPLLGYSLEDAAAVIGRSRHWVSRVRNNMMRGEAPPSRHGGRRTAVLTEDEEFSLVRAAIQKDVWYTDRGSLRAHLREALASRPGDPPSESTLTAILDRAAVHFLKDKRARSADIERLATAFARLWFTEKWIADHVNNLRG